ncbi:hypothetical protein ACP70R_041830 [Stipagrostis hirtigluma subsp. patula]
MDLQQHSKQGDVESETDPMDTASVAIPVERQECADVLSVAEVNTAAYISDGCSTPNFNKSIPLSGAAYMSDGCSTSNYSRSIPLSVAAYMSDGCSSPSYIRSIPFCDSSCTPECDEEMKPAKGMEFESLDDAEVFYRLYAIKVGFDVRVGQSRKVDGIAVWKRFYCNKEGERSSEKEEAPKIMDISTQKRNTRIVRCGCEAKVTVTRTPDNRYIYSDFVERHTHALVTTPARKQFLKANRKVSDKVKNSLLTCHKASIGTSAAYRLLRVSEGGFEFAGCTLRDMQNFHRKVKCAINSADAQMFIENLNRKKEANPGFFFDYVLDDEKRLVRVFWADATCRKNYAHFGDVVSFDSTYKTNQYDMMFAPFTGVNHHKACVMFGAAFISNEKIESYKWVFETFLKAMGGKAPRLIITDEDASMKVAIECILPSTLHRLCMWHIIRKLPDKVGNSLKCNPEFYKRVNSCVWGSETPNEFEANWSSFISEFGLEGNVWFEAKYHIRQKWIPAYCRDVYLAGILRTTSRSESENNFFRHFIGFKYALVEFWLRFSTAMEEQRHHELEADNANLHSTPKLKTSWPIEKNGSEVFTHQVFTAFQREVLAARDHCFVESTHHDGELKTMEISDDSTKLRVVNLNTSNMVASCSCNLLQSIGVPCRHIIHVLRGAKVSELPSHYVNKRWTKWCKKEAVFDGDGNLLEDKYISSDDSEMLKLASAARNDMEESIILAAQSKDIMELVRKSLADLVLNVRKMVPEHQQTKQGEIEAFIGCSIPGQVDILAPGNVEAKGRRKRFKGHADKGGQRDIDARKKRLQPTPRLCRMCNQMVLHDKRNCPNKHTAT